MPGPATLVLFGATSDLARSKLWPALHDLAASGRLPEPCRVLGVSRSATTEQLRAGAAEHGPSGRLGSTKRW
jgi:glucose-6-phosphate 1-dehydrogenase